MNNFLLKTGMFLMFIAGIFILINFTIFAFLSVLALAPGLIIYNIAIKNIYKGMMQPANSNDEGMKTINAAPSHPAADFAGKGKAFAKSIVRKIRNFLNKYAD